MEERRRRRHSVSFPLFLIAAGVYLLAWNLGLTSWSPWEVATTFWPLLIIGLGLDYLLGRVSGWIAIPLAALLLAALAASVLALSGRLAGPAWRSEVEPTPVRVPLTGASFAHVNLDLVGGRLALDAAAPAGDLLTGTASMGDGSRLVVSKGGQGEELVVTLRSRELEGHVGPVFLGRPFDRRRWDLHLRPGLPLVLDAELAAGRARLDLSGLAVSRLDLTLKVGDADLVLPADAADAAADLRVKLSHLEITIPEGVAARIRVYRHLAALHVDEHRFPSRDGVYESEGFDAAPRRVTMEVDATLSDVVIR